MPSASTWAAPRRRPRSGRHLLPARRKGARGQDRGAAEMGRSVPVRSGRRGSAVPSRAGRATTKWCRACRTRSAPSAYAGIPITYPGAGDTVTFVRGHEDEGREKARIDWAALAKLEGTIVSYAGPQQLPKMLAGADRHTAARPTNRRQSSSTARCRRSGRSPARLASSPISSRSSLSARACWSSARSSTSAITCAGSIRARYSAVARS